jgi:two-component system response regulator YesN
MAYRLLIVDDEEHIREGLSDLIDWASLGFEVAAKLEDGRQALDWLRRTNIDIILSDIKMTVMSGLELAKYVCEHYPQTKMVLISGFKEFDFARQAMRYNVVNYLLKPTTLSDIVSVFQDVRKRLDKEREEQEQFARAIQQNSELLPTIRKQLFQDLADGKRNDPQEVEKLLRLSEIDADTTDCRCALIRLSFPAPDEAAAGADGHFALKSVENMVCQVSEGIVYVPVRLRQDGLTIVALDLERNRDPGLFRETASACIQAIVMRISSVLGLRAKLEMIGHYANLRAWMDEISRSGSFGSDSPPPETEQAEPPLPEHPAFAEQCKLFLSYAGAGNIEALPGQYEKVIESAAQGGLPLDYVKHTLIELFSALCRKLDDMDMPISKAAGRPFRYETILRLKSCPDMLRWGVPLLEAVAAYAKAHTEREPAMIKIVKDYVAAHFHQDLSLETAASLVYLSPDYFGKQFKQHTGTSFTDYVMEVRMNKALEYLRDPQYKVYEVGSAVGYKNTKYFFRLFKKHTGYTPSEYRRRAIRKEQG